MGLEEIRSLNVLPVPADQLASVLFHAWDSIAKGIKLETGDVTLGLAKVLRGGMMLWCAIEDGEPPAIRATFMTEVAEMEDGRRLLVVGGLAGASKGDAFRLLRAIDATMIEHATRMRCDAVRFVGRQAYRKLLPSYREVGVSGAFPIFERAVA